MLTVYVIAQQIHGDEGTIVNWVYDNEEAAEAKVAELQEISQRSGLAVTVWGGPVEVWSEYRRQDVDTVVAHIQRTLADVDFN